MQQNYRNLRSTARYWKTNHFRGHTKQIKAKQTQSVTELRSLSHKCKSEWEKGMSMLGETPSWQTWQADHFQVPTLTHDHTTGIWVTEATESVLKLKEGSKVASNQTWAWQGQSKKAYIWNKKEKEWSLSYSTSSISTHGVLREYARLKKPYTGTVELACDKILK